MPLTMVLLGRLIAVALALISKTYFWHLVSYFCHQHSYEHYDVANIVSFGALGIVPGVCMIKRYFYK